MDKGSVNACFEEVRDSYYGIPVTSLCVDTITDFDLYLDAGPGKAPVLYREKDLSFTENARQRLAANHVARLLVEKRQAQAYRQYVERNLPAILRDENLSAEEKSSILYTSAQGLIREVMEDPRSGNVIQRSAELVANTADFMLHDRRAFAGLLKVTSFDYYTYTHSVNVFVFSLALAQRMGHGPDTVKLFGNGALLHDLGKSQLDPAIINCRGKLNDAQWQIMKRHPELGEEILLEQGMDEDIVLDVTRHHHEKLGGKGYPDGLKSGQISPFVRIVTVADIFDALTTRRSYKKAMNSYPALSLMRDEMDGELDPDVFRVFVEMMARPAG